MTLRTVECERPNCLHPRIRRTAFAERCLRRFILSPPVAAFFTSFPSSLDRKCSLQLGTPWPVAIHHGGHLPAITNVAGPEPGNGDSGDYLHVDRTLQRPRTLRAHSVELQNLRQPLFLGSTHLNHPGPHPDQSGDLLSILQHSPTVAEPAPLQYRLHMHGPHPINSPLLATSPHIAELSSPPDH